MIKVTNIFDLDGLEKEIADGYITKRKHPTLPYFILNYTTKTQIEWRWNIYTVNCRGLIVDDKWNIIARPFKKFFALDQWNSLRNYVWNLYNVKFSKMFDGPFDILEKMDGSLGILFKNPQTNKYEMASRGSFESDQAIRGTKILQEKYSDIQPFRGLTYLFEIIYPENKIVVDYGDKEDLILLAVIDNETGKEIDVDYYNEGYTNLCGKVHIAQKFNFDNWRDLDKLNWKNAEGFVIRFLDNDIRLKIKFDEYKSLAKILKSLDEHLVLEWTKNDYDFKQSINILPEKTRNWIINLNRQYLDDYKGIERECLRIVDIHGGLSRREFAELYSKTYFSPVLFRMLDKKDYKDTIWKVIEKRINNGK